MIRISSSSPFDQSKMLQGIILDFQIRTKSLYAIEKMTIKFKSVFHCIIRPLKTHDMLDSPIGIILLVKNDPGDIIFYVEEEADIEMMIFI